MKFARFPIVCVVVLISLLTYGQGPTSKNKSKTSGTQVVVEDLVSTARTYLYNEDSLDQAVELLKKAYKLSDESGYVEGKILSGYQLARGYLVMSQNAEASKYFYITLKEAEKRNDSLYMSRAYMGLGLVMYGMTKWSDAINHFNLSIKFQTEDAKLDLMKYLMGLSFYNLKEFTKAEVYLDLAKKRAIERKDTSRLLEIQLYRNHIHAASYDSAKYLAVYDSLIHAFKQRGGKVGMCYSLEGKARYLLKLGKAKEASGVAYEALVVARSMKLINPKKEVLETLVRTEYDNGRYKSSVDFLIELEQIKDSLVREDAASQIALLNADHEINKKEAKYDEELSQQKRQRIGLGVLAGVLILTSFFIFLALRSVAKERKRSDNLLANILPKETALELKKNGVAKAKAHKNVTIVFADIKNFTSIANDLDPEVLVEMLDTYFSDFDKIIKRHKLEKIKTIGDAYMFVSGLQSGGSLSALSAIAASLEMIQVTHNLKNLMKEKYGVYFEFRIGMHSGDVVSGVVGSVKYAFDIWGNSVNLAARMEENSSPGKINISGDTYQLIRDSYVCESRGKVSVKNGGEREMLFVLHKKAQVH
jgi:class 3 adenylate cyclase